MKLTLILITILCTYTSAQSSLCIQCRNSRDYLIDWTDRLKSKTLVEAISICSLVLDPKICYHYVMMIGNPALSNSLKYAKQSDYFCADLFCFDNDSIQLKESDFENYLKYKFPKKSEFKMRNNDDGDFNILVLNDSHLQKDYKEGTITDCGKPAGCCTENSGQAKKGEGAGFGEQEKQIAIFLKELF